MAIQAQARQDADPVAVGDVLDGFCSGVFGRDEYGEKAVIAIGQHWCIARNSDGTLLAALDHGGNDSDIRDDLREFRDA